MRQATLYLGDCVEVMRGLEAESVDAVVCDPPYELGFMGKAWDSTGIAYQVETWAAAARILKPGAHLLAFGGTRTYHRLACAIEDAGFEIRDSLHWIYGSGFPKSHNGEWGGTALKPAHEPIVVARKPLIGTVAANVERFGTGALNVDGCRVAMSDSDGWDVPQPDTNRINPARSGDANGSPTDGRREDGARATPHDAGRWPPNVLLSPEAAEEMDRQSGVLTSGSRDAMTTNGLGGAGRYGSMPNAELPALEGDAGGASRFFPCFRYEAKPSRAERNAGLEGMEKRSNLRVHAPRESEDAKFATQMQNHHPTVKPIALMAWLCRLVTPAGGVVLDPFLGSGTTGIAALREGIRFVGIEREPEYMEIAQRRIREDAPMFNRVEVVR